MKTSILFGAGALMLAVPALANDPAELPRWLGGAWQEEGEDGHWAEEIWTLPRAGLMLGAARMSEGERVNAFEYSRIVRMPDSKLVFVVQPFGNTAVHFPMVAGDAQMIEFANAAHDYPQRIRYWREGKELRARISLMDGSKAMEWRYQPVGNTPD